MTKYTDFLHVLKLVATIIPLRSIPYTRVAYPLAIRCDVDSDLPTAIKLAKITEDNLVPASVYLLHSQPYFFQSTLISNIHSMLIEVGLHTDPYYYYSLNKDGAAHVVGALDYLRNLGIPVTSTCAHNSFPIHHAEAFEIFIEYQRTPNLCPFPTGLLSQDELGLTYEANHPIISTSDLIAINDYCRLPSSTESEPWMHYYLHSNPTFQHAYDVSVWYHIDDTWTIASNRHHIWHWKVSTNKLFNVLETFLPGMTTVITIHPEFFKESL